MTRREGPPRGPFYTPHTVARGTVYPLVRQASPPSTLALVLGGVAVLAAVYLLAMLPALLFLTLTQ